MVREAQLFGGSSDMPIVPFQSGQHDLSLGLAPQTLKAPVVGYSAHLAPFLNLERHVLRAQHLAVSRDDHALDHIPKLSYVIVSPVVSHE